MPPQRFSLEKFMPPHRPSFTLELARLLRYTRNHLALGPPPRASYIPVPVFDVDPLETLMPPQCLSLARALLLAKNIKLIDDELFLSSLVCHVTLSCPARLALTTRIIRSYTGL